MTDNNKLTSARVEEVFMDCLFKDGESQEKFVLAEGVVGRYGFHPDRLESHREDVKELLSWLPPEFQEGTGGGWSFLNACNDREGNQWTGEHRIMEQLFALGLGLGLVESQLPREYWNALPGGMPYYMVKSS